MKNITIALLLLFISVDFYGQSPEREVAKVLAQYKALNKVDVAIHYYYYDNHDTKMVTEEALGIYQKDGAKMRIIQYGTEMINDGKYVLVKDDTSKVMGLTNHQEGEQTSFNIEEALNNYDKIERLAVKKENQQVYLIYFKKESNSEYEKAKVYVNTKTNLLDEIVLYYNKAHDLSTDPRKQDYQKPKLRMVYTKVDTKPVFARGTFSVSKYVNISLKGKSTLKKEFASYEFYDQTK